MPLGYAELSCRSNFSFLEGASHPEELITAAQALGVSALALTDSDGLYGTVKAHLAAKGQGLKLLTGARLTLSDAPPLHVYACNKQGYTHLCQLISKSRLSNPKGEASLPWRELAERAEGLIAMLAFPDAVSRVAPLAEAFPGRFYMGLCRTHSAGDEAQLFQARALSKALALPEVAHNDVHTHARTRQPLQDVLCAIRHQLPLSKMGRRLFPNAERTLKSPGDMYRLFDDAPEAVERTLEIAEACNFSLDALRYHFPEEDLPQGHTPATWLREQTYLGLAHRYGQVIPGDVVKQVEHELVLIEKLDFPGYFLALHDIVQFARRQGILCQGRGSAANSAVCYALGITSIDPVRMGLLFERFISLSRPEPPDIDVDFEHERREEVLQYVYQKHGRHRAAMVCEVICYRGKLAAREVGKALGLSLDQVDRLAKHTDSHTGEGLTEQRLAEAGLSAQDATVLKVVEMANQLEGYPRHLSIHVGGFVITREPLVDIVPVENAAMAGRTVVQWDKDDINALAILKVDLLALGILTALSRCFALLKQHSHLELSLATLPPEDPRVYDMMCRADTIGLFQIESRAQMQLLPKLRPKTFYDLVIQVALIRPGPIIGEMVHPYLRRREGLEEVTYPSPQVQAILQKTLGVPLFQEQAMKIAMVAAGFTPVEADQLRKILSRKDAEKKLEPLQKRFIEGCLNNGYEREFAERCFNQFRGFAHYGFPESHAASFALIAYASAYLKCYHPAAFTCALLNSQPMGFYAPHTLVEDVKRHGVEVRPVDVRFSDWDCTLEPSGEASGEPSGEPSGAACALRLGLRMVRGLREETGRRLEKTRPLGFDSVAELARRTRVPRHELARLALAGALSGISGGRREALWQIQALGPLEEEDLFFGLAMDETEVDLPKLSPVQRVAEDYGTVGLSLEHHPLELMRPSLNKRRAITAEAMMKAKPGRFVGIGGLAICRQRPPTAKGVCFISLEDETGISNLVVPPELFERYRKEILSAVFLYAEGKLERSGRVVNLKVHHLTRMSLAEEAST